MSIPSDEHDDPARLDEDPGYQPPRITRLGTLTELTLGGTAAVGDGFGGAGSTGSIPF